MMANANHILFSLTVLLGPAALALLISGCGNHPVEHRGLPSDAGGIVAHAAAGDPAAVRRSLAAGEQAGARNSHGETALMAAAINGHTQVVRLLVRRSC